MKKGDVITKHFKSTGMGGQYGTHAMVVTSVRDGVAIVRYAAYPASIRGKEFRHRFSVAEDDQGRMGYSAGPTETWYTKA